MRKSRFHQPELSILIRLCYPPNMSSTAHWRLQERNRAACALALAIVVLATGLPMASFCCVPGSPCCAVGRSPQGAPQAEMSSRIPDCCQPLVRNEMPVTSEKLVPLPDAHDFATLPSTSSIAANLPSESRPPTPAADPQPGPSPPQHGSRSPPLS